MALKYLVLEQRGEQKPGRWGGEPWHPSDSIRDPTNDPMMVGGHVNSTSQKGHLRRIARKQPETGLSTAGPTRIRCVYSMTMTLVPSSIAAVVFRIRGSHEFEIW